MPAGNGFAMSRRKRRPAGRPASRPARRSPPPPPPLWRRLPFRATLPGLHPLAPRTDVLGVALIFAGAFALYAVSAPRAVMLEDDGLFITTATFAGVAHPPGYPLYVLLGWLAALVPFGEVAWRVHALSGLMGALTCASVAWIVLRRTGDRPAAWLAGGALAVSGDFWSQAIIADVYTTNTAAVFLTLALAQEAAAARSARLWIAAAAVYGLGLANHYPLLILASPLFLACAAGAGRDFGRRVVYLVPVAALAAAALYGWMVWRSHQPAPVNFLGPIGSWGEFLSFVDRSIYSHIDQNPNAGLVDKLFYTGHFAAQALLQFGVVGTLVALWGVFASLRSGRRLGLSCEALAFVASSFLLIAMLGFNYEPLRISTFRPYPLVAYGILALWMGHGAHALIQWVRTRREPLLPAVHAAGALLVAGLCAWNAGANYRPHDRFAEEQALALLDIAEEDGVFVLYSDPFVGPMSYLHWVEGVRPNLRLLEYHGVYIADRVVQPLWPTRRKTAGWAGFLRDTDLPVYSLWYGPAFSGAGLAHLGFFVRVHGGAGPGRIEIRANDKAKAYFGKLIAMPTPRDLPSAIHRNEMLRAYGEYLGLAQVNERSSMHRYVADVVPLAAGNYWSLMGMSKALATQPGDRPLRLAEAYLRRALELAGDDRGKENRATERFVEGQIALRRGDAGEARRLFRESLSIDRGAENHARQALEKLNSAGGG